MTFGDLIVFAQSDWHHFLHCIDLCDNNAKVFWQEFGFDFRRLHAGIPSEREFEKRASQGFHQGTNVVSEAVTRLFEYFNQALEKEKRLQTNLTTLTTDDFNILEQRINFERFQRAPVNVRRFTPREYFWDFITQHHPFREDYFASKVIKPGEQDAVIKRFGRASVLTSLSINDPDSLVLLETQTGLKP